MKYVKATDPKNIQFLEQHEQHNVIPTPAYMIFYIAERNGVSVKGVADSFNPDAMAAKIETIARLEGELNCKNIEILAVESTTSNNDKMLAESTRQEAPVLDFETLFKTTPN